MGRLYALTGLALLALGCESEPEPVPAGGSRVNAVMATPKAPSEAAEGFCDARHAPGQAPTFRWPQLAGEAPVSKGDWQWVNLWATWCKPCIEEMPRLQQWSKKLAERGVKVDLQFLSVEHDAEAIAKFRAEHPSTPESLRLAEDTNPGEWLTSMEAGELASVPVHLFVDADRKLRCVRAGGLEDRDFDAVAAFLGAEPR